MHSGCMSVAFLQNGGDGQNGGDRQNGGDGGRASGRRSSGR